MPTTYSPLRYPGGKTKLYPIVRPIINANLSGSNRIYIEPFAGGAGLALKLLYCHDVDKIILNDVDASIFAFWNSCLHNTDALCDMILSCPLTLDEWHLQKDIYCNPQNHSELEIGFATFFLNRCNVSGIIRGGPIGGKKQTGSFKLDARFNRKSLIEKIRRIGANSSSIDFYNLDATYFMTHLPANCNGDNIILNIDPPYVRKGNMLYENAFTEQHHVLLANVISTLPYKWLVTYDWCDLIDHLYSKYRKEIIQLNYSIGSAKSGQELLIYGDSIDLPSHKDTH